MKLFILSCYKGQTGRKKATNGLKARTSEKDKKEMKAKKL